MITEIIKNYYHDYQKLFLHSLQFMRFMHYQFFGIGIIRFVGVSFGTSFVESFDCKSAWMKENDRRIRFRSNDF